MGRKSEDNKRHSNQGGYEAKLMSRDEGQFVLIKRFFTELLFHKSKQKLATVGTRYALYTVACALRLPTVYIFKNKKRYIYGLLKFEVV